MTFKLNSQLSLIKSPVILVVEGEEERFSCGDELVSLTFEKRYVVDSIVARESNIVVRLKENNQSFNINWVGEEAVSFM